MPLGQNFNRSFLPVSNFIASTPDNEGKQSFSVTVPDQTVKILSISVSTTSPTTFEEQDSSNPLPAKFLILHLLLSNPLPAGASIEIDMKNGQKDIFTQENMMNVNFISFWTRPIKGNIIDITMKNTGATELIIDKFAFGHENDIFAPSGAQISDDFYKKGGIGGNAPKWKDLSETNAINSLNTTQKVALQAAGATVGMIVWVGADDRIHSGTGIYRGNNLVMTAFHLLQPELIENPPNNDLISSNKALESASFTPDYATGESPTYYKFHPDSDTGFQEVGSDSHQIDYAMLQIMQERGAIDDTPLNIVPFVHFTTMQTIPNTNDIPTVFRSLSNMAQQTHPNIDEKVYIIHHPRGRKKKISYDPCQAKIGVEQWENYTTMMQWVEAIGYDCDCDDGSSGAPVFVLDGNDVKLVGLVTATREDSDANNLNTSGLNAGPKVGTIFNSFAKFSDDKTGEIQLVLVVDRSGSMQLMDANGIVRIDAAKQAITNLLELLKFDAKIKVGLVTYSSNVNNIISLSVYDSAQKSTLMSTTNSQVPHGMTGIGAALEAAKDLFSQTDNKPHILLLTDGLENQAPKITDVLSAGTIPSGAVVDTIGFGSDTTINGDLLATLAQRYRGIFLHDLNGLCIKKYYAMLYGDIFETTNFDPDFVIPAGELDGEDIEIPVGMDSELTLNIGWVRSDASLTFELIAPSGQVIPEFDPNDRSLIETKRGDTWYFRRLALPYKGEQAGIWTVKVSRAADTEVVFNGNFGSVLKLQMIDGNRVISASNPNFSFLTNQGLFGNSAYPPNITVWDSEKLQAILPLLYEQADNGKTSSFALDLVLSPDKKFVASTSESRSVTEWDLDTTDEVRSYEQTQENVYLRIAYHPTNNWIAAGHASGFTIWDRSEGEVIHDLSDEAMTYDLAFSPDGTQLAIATGSPDFDRPDLENDGITNTTVIIYELDAFTVIRRIQEPGDLRRKKGTSIAYHPDGNQVIVNELLKSLLDPREFVVESEDEDEISFGFHTIIYNVSDGSVAKRLAVGGIPLTAALEGYNLSVRTQNILTLLQPQLSSDGHYLTFFALAMDGLNGSITYLPERYYRPQGDGEDELDAIWPLQLVVFDLNNDTIVRRLGGSDTTNEDAFVTYMAGDVNPQQQQVISGEDNGRIRVWDLNTGKPAYTAASFAEDYFLTSTVESDIELRPIFSSIPTPYYTGDAITPLLRLRNRQGARVDAKITLTITAPAENIGNLLSDRGVREEKTISGDVINQRAATVEDIHRTEDLTSRQINVELFDDGGHGDGAMIPDGIFGNTIADFLTTHGHYHMHAVAKFGPNNLYRRETMWGIQVTTHIVETKIDVIEETSEKVICRITPQGPFKDKVGPGFEEKFDIDVPDPAIVEKPIKDNGDGTYDITITYPNGKPNGDSSEYKITIKQPFKGEVDVHIPPRDQNTNSDNGGTKSDDEESNPNADILDGCITILRRLLGIVFPR